MPETIDTPIRILDVNKDAVDDILLDLGIYGKIKIALCYVYDKEQYKYVAVDGFDKLMTPSYVHNDFFYEYWRGDATEFGLNKYKIIGCELKLIASLYEKYGDEGVRYTEKILVNDQMTTVKENVTFEEIDPEEWDYKLVY